MDIADYLRHELNYKNAIKAINALRALNLIVVKCRPNAPDVLELHPLVRQFVRRNFPRDERRSYIDAIIRVYKRFIGTHKIQLSERPSLSTLQYWTQNAELDVEAGHAEDAFATLAEVATPFRSSAYPREFSRTARLLLASIDWTAEHGRFKGFDTVFQTHVENLSYLGEYSEADALLDSYEMTVPSRDVRYILYCYMRCFTDWVRGDFKDAVRWGKVGTELKTSSDVDTGVDIAHQLALAERDAGLPERALPVFLNGRALSEVLDPEDLDERRGGPHYGNIGRCLHFMGQIDNALICYQKSALLIERSASEHVLNQGYIRFWIGELLAARQQLRLARMFLLAACQKWELAAPPKAIKVRVLLRQLGNPDDQVETYYESAERVCLNWILGRNVES